MNECPSLSIYFHSEVLTVAGNGQIQRVKKICIGVCLTIGIFYGITRSKANEQAQQETEKSYAATAGFFTKHMENTYFLLAPYLKSDEPYQNMIFEMEQVLDAQFPLYRYLCLTKEEEQKEQDEVYIAQMIQQLEGTDEDNKNIEEDTLDYDENALHIENSILREMEEENGLHNEENSEEASIEAAIEEFVPVSYPAYSYDWSEMWDYEKIVSNFYAVDQSTLLTEDHLDLNQLLETDLAVDKSVEGPQILIYHTHSNETFADSAPGDVGTSIVGAGEKLASILQEEYGFRVLHHQGVYDQERSEAYSEALPEIEKLLAENPTIEVVIDLHRDEMTGDRKLVMDLQGKPTARFMFFNGLSYTKNNGDISYLENPHIQDNLAFSFQAQVAANEYYPGIARKIYLKAYRYNMHLKPKSMLIELGAQNNTVEEIFNACQPLAHILAIVLDEML